MDRFTADCIQGCGINTASNCNYQPLGSLPSYTDCNGKTQFDPFDKLCEMCQDGIPLLQFGCDLGLAGGMIYDWFEVKDLNVSEVGGFSVAVKNLLFYKTNPIIQMGVKSHDGDGVRWGEQTHQQPETTLTADIVAWATSIFLEDTSRFNTNSVIKMRFLPPAPACCYEEIDVIATTIDHATGEVDLKAPVVLPAWVTEIEEGTRVVRVTRLFDPCTSPEVNQYYDYTKYYKSYYQWFAGAFDMDTNDMNKCFGNGQDALSKLKYHKKQSFQDTLYDMLGAKWFASNVPYIANTQSAQTMGIISSIQYYHDQFQLDNIHSFRNFKTNQSKALALYLVLEKSMNCHVMGGSKKIHVACTKLFYESLRFLAPYFNRLMGCNSLCEKDAVVKFEVRKLEFDGGEVNFYIDPYLSYMYEGESKAVYMPADQYAVFSPAYLEMDNNGDLAKADTSFKMEYDWTGNVGKIGSCNHKFIYYNRFAFIPMGITTCSWGIIEDLWMDGITPSTLKCSTV